MSDGITCRYCDGTHSLASQVRECWEASRTAKRGPVNPEPPDPASRADALTVGVSALGRSVVVSPGRKVPEAWARCERWSGDVDTLEAAWRERRPLIIELDGDPTEADIERRPVWSLEPCFSLGGERLREFMFANSVDARGGNQRWPLGEAARKLGASAGGAADVVLPDGSEIFCDGGPLRWRRDVSGVPVVSRVAVEARSLIPFGPNDTEAELSADQRAAVTHAGGSARIIAPAGSGKTRVLTERARHLLRRWNLPASAITLVAYNKRAADEMVARTTDLPELRVRTLNSLGLSVVNRERRVSTIGEPEVRAILDSLVDLPRRANTDPAVAWMEALSRVRLGLTEPAQVEAEYGGDVDGLASVIERYREILADRGIVDFDEQIYGAIEILLCDPLARRRARAACRVLLVDEFQDLTPAHLLLIRLLAGPLGEVFGVGDDDQTIYGYAGASPEWLIGYRRFFPGAGEHALRVNYRCPPGVITAAATLLTHNRRRVAKDIAPAPDRPAAAADLRIIEEEDAVKSTVDAVDALIGLGSLHSEIAVLARVNSSLVPVQVALVDKGVPVRVAVGESYLSRAGVRAALAWLRLATADPSALPGSDIAAAARRPSRGLPPRVVEWMAEQRDGRSLGRLAGRLGDRDARKIRGFVADLELVSHTAKSGTTAQVLTEVRDKVGLEGAMQLLESAHRRLDRSAQTDDLDSLVAIAGLHRCPSSFEPWLRETIGRPGSADGVTLATIHSVKGQEWPHVVVHDVESTLLPHRLSDDIEEERRILHVAITRCSRSVTVVAGASPSPFVAEMFARWDPSAPPTPFVDLRSRRAGSGKAVSSDRRDVSPRSQSRRREIPARIGLEVDRGGHHGRIIEIDPDGAVISVGRGRVRVPYGSTVRVDGALMYLTREPPSAAVTRAAVEVLRQWRSQRSRADKKPAYIYLTDAAIETLAATLPPDLAGLAKIKGLGPAKLEAYGDEILSLLDRVRDT